MNITKRAMLEHAVIPATGAGLAALVAAVRMRNVKVDTKDKIKRLARNAALGLLVGSGVEGARVGITNLTSKDIPDLGNTTVEGNFIEN